MTPVLIIVGIFTVLAACSVLIWIFVPVFQCPVCHSYRVKELETELGKMLHCENEDCKHDWRSM